MTLTEALREHTGCTHSLSIEYPVGAVVVTHDGGMQRWPFAASTKSVYRGSALFHDCAAAILRDGPHELSDLSLSDEQYEGFCDG